MVGVIEKVLLGLSAAGFALFASASQASAHVKWFSNFDVAAAPDSLDYVFNTDFKILVLLALLVMALGCLLEESPLGPPVMKAFDNVTAWLRTDTDKVVRAVCAFFFISLWTMGGIILTPELKTDAAAISWLQLAMAIALIWRATSPLAALGIVFLFAFAVWEYGIFHMADYPIFLGIAAYLALTGLKRDFFGIRPLDIMRWAAGITLMWASIEKWAYPEWSYPLLAEHPSLIMGYDGGFFMRAAGVIEFTLAFALLWTPLVRRGAAVILSGMFLAACFEFGKLDVIGHSCIIIVLLAIMSDNVRRDVKRKHMLLAPVGYAAALAGFLGMYYGGHAVLFSTPQPHMSASATVETVAEPAVVEPAIAESATAESAAETEASAPRRSYGSHLIQREPPASSLDESRTAR
jgi:hypothetical protein